MVANAMENDNWLADLMHDMSAPSLLSSLCFGSKWMVHILMPQITSLTKLYGVARRTSGTRLALLTRCSSMEVWNQRFWQRYGESGLPHAARFSPGCCFRTMYGTLID
jgi:hypothetical protein